MDVRNSYGGLGRGDGMKKKQGADKSRRREAKEAATRQNGAGETMAVRASSIFSAGTVMRG